MGADVGGGTVVLQRYTLAVGPVQRLIEGQSIGVVIDSYDCRRLGLPLELDPVPGLAGDLVAVVEEAGVFDRQAGARAGRGGFRQEPA